MNLRRHKTDIKAGRSTAAPSAGSATTAALYFSDGLGGQEAINRQCRFVVTKPTAITPAATVDQELANAMRSD
jgi:hypothetical protein